MKSSEGVQADKVPGPLIAQVAVPLPIATTAFSYLIPAELLSRAIPGVRVTVPFRNTEITGYLVGTESASSAPTKKLKSILAILDDQPVLPSSMLQLTKWVGEYYGSSWGEAIENALPRWVKYGKKTEKYIEKARGKNSVPVKAPSEYTLSAEQEKAFRIIGKALKEKHPKSMLIYGVTGSGKSEL